MTLRLLKDGSFSIGSKADAAEARERIDELEAAIEVYETDPDLVALRNESAALLKALNTWVVDKFSAGEGYEDDHWKGTKVVSTSRSWNATALTKLIPKAMIFKVCKLVVDADKLDAAVAAGEIDSEKIAPALIETPKQPFVRWTAKKPDAKAEKQVDAKKLADVLGD